MLKQRLLTIALLLPLFVWSIFGLSTPHFALLLAFLVLLGAWEWAALMGLSHARRPLYLAGVVAVMLLCAWLMALPVTRMALLAATLAWWLFALWLIRRFQREDRVPAWMLGGGRAGGHPAHPWLFGLLGLVVLVPCWAAMTLLHGGIGGSGTALVFMLMLLVWGADSGAYIAGRLWGHTRLASHVSPGKTWEGVYGALLAAVAISTGFGLWFELEWAKLALLVALSVVTVLFSIVGDLFESLVKRIAGVKDSGRLLPGHGGVLDRIDSITAAAPVFVLGLLWQGVLP